MTVAAALGLTACGLPAPGDEIVEGFIGGVIADEPRAALVGRDVLAAGGSAADAMVATYFALAVTMPGAASLGGGGVCLTYDRDRVDSLSFLPARPRAATGPDFAVPGAIRGMFALHARDGRLSWASLLAPAEQLARQGHTASRAFATELAKVAPVILADPDARAVFADETGALVTEGQQIRQVELGAVLSILRLRGPGAFYEGQLGRRFVEAVQTLGSAMTAADLRLYRPQPGPTIQIPMGNNILHFAPPPALGGATAAQLWTMLTSRDRYTSAGGADRAHLFAEASLRAYADRPDWPVTAGTTDPQVLVEAERIAALMASYDASRHVPAQTLRPASVIRAEPPGAVGAVAVDRDGEAVACGFTLNQTFGAGRIAPGTGILLAAPQPQRQPTTSIAPVLAVNPNVDSLILAGVGVGGAPAATALTTVLIDLLASERPLEDALAAPRLHHTGSPDLLLHETGLARTDVLALQSRGHVTRPVERLGLVSALYCPGGLPRSTACEFAVDPRSFGLAAGQGP